MLVLQRHWAMLNFNTCAAAGLVMYVCMSNSIRLGISEPMLS